MYLLITGRLLIKSQTQYDYRTIALHIQQLNQLVKQDTHKNVNGNKKLREAENTSMERDPFVILAHHRLLVVRRLRAILCVLAGVLIVTCFFPDGSVLGRNRIK